MALWLLYFDWLQVIISSHCIFFMVILDNFGEVVDVELAMDRAVSCQFAFSLLFLALLVKIFVHNFFTHLQVNRPKRYAYVEFKARTDAEKAQLAMDGVRLS